MQYYTSPFNKEEEYKFPKDITIYDTTLRDGEQTPGSETLDAENRDKQTTYLVGGKSDPCDVQVRSDGV